MSLRIVTIGFLLLMITVVGCSEKQGQTSFVSKSLQDITSPQEKQTKTHPPSVSTAPQTIHPINAPKIPPIGITVDQSHIVIDTQQTQRFLESFTKEINQKFKKIEQGLRRVKLRTPNDTGIIIAHDRIEVDLNKTEHFVKNWMESIEEVGKQLDGIAKELDASFQP